MGTTTKTSALIAHRAAHVVPGRVATIEAAWLGPSSVD
jgi:hypothetical protein